MGRCFCRACDNAQVRLDWVRGQLELGSLRLVGIYKMVLGELLGCGEKKGFLVSHLGGCVAEEAKTAKADSSEICFVGDGISFWV